MDDGNLVYIAFANIPEKHVLVCYPTVPSKGTDGMVTDGLTEVYDDSVKTKDDKIIKKLVLEYHTVYYLADESATAAIIVMIFEDAYPQRLAYSMIQELWKEVLLVITNEGYCKVRPRTLKKLLKGPFSKIFKRYDNVVELDDALRLKVKIDHATENVEDTMHQILDTCINLEELQVKTQKLKRNAIVMQQDSVILKQELGTRMVFVRSQ